MYEIGRGSASAAELESSATSEKVASGPSSSAGEESLTISPGEIMVQSSQRDCFSKKDCARMRSMYWLLTTEECKNRSMKGAFPLWIRDSLLGRTGKADRSTILVGERGVFPGLDAARVETRAWRTSWLRVVSLLSLMPSAT